MPEAVIRSPGWQASRQCWLQSQGSGSGCRAIKLYRRTTCSPASLIARRNRNLGSEYVAMAVPVGAILQDQGRPQSTP